MVFEFFALKIDILLQKETKNIVFQDMSKDTEKTLVSIFFYCLTSIIYGITKSRQLNVKLL